ncbi:energy-coupling factor transporter transmembrane component T family protein [Saccharibacillus kuerlensis]|uniref:Cobalt transporter CbiQ n=1 Tax=Saccharibacillus kuerlensis TaxID=459527 RepID=A0ABQ2L448_9BACL|nr:energy-coupling factor transporter transmembrane component T [Saccharibacillus kuerlensis]GGO01943.1 cobalt transporter CbiQ [Saccharibacillus kuerlensis]
MPNSLLIGRFVERDSVLHRLDPRTKLLGMLIMMAVFLTVKSWDGYTAATAFVLLTAALSRIPIGLFLRGLLPVLPILSFALLYHIMFGRGETVLWSYSWLHIHAEGVVEGIRIVWRILLLILLASVLTGTTRPLSLAQGLETLLKPLSKLGVPIEQFSLMIVIAIRFIPTILDELNRILLAQKARGHDLSTMPPAKRLFAFVPILVPLLVTTVQRAEQLTLAIDARGYGDGRGRTTYRPLAFGRIDYLALGTVALLAAALYGFA